jgi:hypothetical protein
MVSSTTMVNEMQGMIDQDAIRQFYRRLNHHAFGITEIVALNKDSGNIIATGFFDDEDKFVSASFAYNGGCNIYAGRNPRPMGFSNITNLMNINHKKRAKDSDIQHITAISLDIDPIRPRGEPSTRKQHRAALSFALDLQWDLWGDVDDSGNGAYLWIPFVTPIKITAQDRALLKKQCKDWQDHLKQKYKPEDYGLKIDACFDFSRIKRVIGTFNHKAQRQSMFVRKGRASDIAREQILQIEIVTSQSQKKTRHIKLVQGKLPTRFKRLLDEDDAVKDLWENPDMYNDRSKHDWKLGLLCLEIGIADPQELAAILMMNPHGKYRRDGRDGYVQMTVEKLMGQKEKGVVL